MKRHKPDIAFIRRYLNGELSPREMYELERQAQDDPMLMDVIMGMESGDADAHRTNLSEIQLHIQQRTQQGKIKHMIAWRPWVVAASVVFVLAIGGWWVVHERYTDQQVAQQVYEPLETRPEVIPESTEEAERATEPIGDDSPRMAATAPVTKQPPIPKLDTSDSRLAALSEAPAVLHQEQIAAERAPQTLSSRAARVASARVDQVDTGQAADALVLDEEVAAKREQSKKVADTINPTPVVGWEYYHEYLRKQTQVEGDKKGTVTLAFTVDELGNPINIRIVEGLIDTLNEKAVQLLRNGSKWRQGSDAKQEVQLKITFHYY